MTVETATYINGLNSALPASTDPKSEGYRHLNLIKSTIQASFPNVTAAANPTAAELNQLVGIGGTTVSAQLALKAPLASPTFTGTPAAPTAAPADNSTTVATTAFVQTAISNVNAASGYLTVSTSASAAISIAAGQKIACTYAGVVTYTLPGSPTLGQRVGIIVANGRADTVVNPNGAKIMRTTGNMTVDNTQACFELLYIDSTNGWVLA